MRGKVKLVSPTWCMKAQAASTLEPSTLGHPALPTPATAAGCHPTLLPSVLPSVLPCLMLVFSMLLFSLGTTARTLQGLRVAGALRTIAS